MHQKTKRSARKLNKFSSIGMIFLLIILSCFVLAACDIPGVSGNGNNNGANNNNNSPSNSCNGYDNCNNYYGNPNQQSGSSSGNASSSSDTTSSSSGNNCQGQRGTDHQADGTDWTINSLGGGAFVVNFYFPNTQYNGNFKLFVPEGTNSITLHGGGGSYWLYAMGCATAAQNDFNTLDQYTAVNLQDLENQGLVS